MGLRSLVDVMIGLPLLLFLAYISLDVLRELTGNAKVR